MSDGPVLAAADAAVRRGGRSIVEGVTFTAARGELVAMMGASGAGKTTVLRAIAGLEPLAAGSIRVDGVELTAGSLPRGTRRRTLHRTVGIVFQFHNLFSHLTVLDNVALAPVHVFGAPADQAARRARALLDSLGLETRAAAMPHELSGGEAQRAAIARALAVDPSILLMDEPTASLDHERRADLAAMLRGLTSEGRTIVVATHDAAFARDHADRTVVFDKGRVVRIE